MKLTLVILLISVTFTAAIGQRKIEDKEPKCSLAMDHAPELRGFRLAATQQNILARFPGVSIEKPDKFGLARLRTGISTDPFRRFVTFSDAELVGNHLCRSMASVLAPADSSKEVGRSAVNSGTRCDR